MTTSLPAMTVILLTWVFGLVACCDAADQIGAQPPLSEEQALRLHVASPDWRDQIIYFVMIDRFDDGDPKNNDQGAGEYDPANPARYSGGDLEGVRRRIEYIRGLGATAVWITPPVAHQWLDPVGGYGGYHGYWGENLLAVDPHFGTLDDYRKLSDGLHRGGMFLLQDVVVNHMGNYFSYPGTWSANDPGHGFVRHRDSQGRRAPSQTPFDRNNARNRRDRRAAIYHWTPTVRDLSDLRQERYFQLADLDDLNTGNPRVRAALRRSYGHWIREVGVDGFRVDTAFYVAPDYFADFLQSADQAAPGMARVAADTGRRQFHVFGEGFGIDRPGQDIQARKIESYARTAEGKELLPAMINFPLYGSTVDVFARGRPSADLAYRIDNMMTVHASPHLMPTFVDNHDVDRFLAGGSEQGLRQALLLIMTLPGIPTIYYGTEQGFTRMRGAMFAAGVDSGGRDHFDVDAPMYRFIRHLTALRKANRVLSRGTPKILAANAAGPGVLVYQMRDAQSSALVGFNSSESPALADNVQTGLTCGAVLTGAFTTDGAAPELVVGVEGLIHLKLPPRSGMVWLVSDQQRVCERESKSHGLSIDELPSDPYRDDFSVSGRASGHSAASLIVDGQFGEAIPLSPDAEGRWRERISTANMVDPAIAHRLVLWSPITQSASAPQLFKVAREWQMLLQVDDPANDDRGPAGKYRYPDDPGWGENRQADLLGVRVFGAGGAMRIELPMHRVTRSWNPANGFDHVAFTVFFELPDREGGSAVMPLQNASLPGAMRWHYRLRVHGWSNALFSSIGASASNEGTVAVPAADITVDHDRNLVTLTLPAASLGGLTSLSGVKLYLNTWDYDAGYRGLSSNGGSHTFAGGDGAQDPRLMDDTAVLTIP